MTKKYILAIDEGTASARAALFDIASKNLVSIAAIGITQHYPKEGWVEHDANQIWQAESEAIRACLKKVDATADEIVGMGMANQRESVLAWNKRTGEPISPVIVWQCRRTAKRCQDLAKTQKKAIKAKTGLIADSYFSATKMEWLLNNNKEVKKLAKSGDLCLGTIDSFLCFKLTGKFVTDVTNASRTMLFNIKKLEWDEELLKMFKIPASALAKVVNCDEIVGETTLFGGGKIAVAGIMGDQQAALFGQCCTSKGMVKSTYGTGCFMLMNIGESFEA
ncbi:MAG: FGGY family carbohydrate kinase, partial [Clostridia bacterium]